MKIECPYCDSSEWYAVEYHDDGDNGVSADATCASCEKNYIIEFKAVTIEGVE